MRALAFALGLLWASCAHAQHGNPQVGDVWLYFGPTLGAGWGDNPTTSAIPNNTVLGNVSGVAAPASALTATLATTLCNTFTSLLKGCVPASGGDAATYLNGAGGFTTPSGTGITQLTGDVTAGPGSGSVATTLVNTSITPGSYTLTNVTFNSQGRATAASSYTGTSCTNQFPRALNAAGVATCSSVANADLTNSSVTFAGKTASLGGSATIACADLSDDGAGCTASAANPTASAGASAVNGSASTYMRSDAAPAVVAASASTAGIAKLHNVPVAVGWPAALNPNNVIIANINQASTISAIVGSVETAVGATSTVSVYKAPSGTACSAGTVLHSGSFNANGTAATNQTLTVTTSSLAAGDRICLQTTGTTNWTSGSGVGTITVFFAPS